MAEKTKLGLGAPTLTDAATGDTLFVATHPGESGPQVGRAISTEGEPGRGDAIGRFVVLGVLGAGGMGLVYSAYDPHLDRKVAIKLLHGGAASSAADARTRLLREAQAMAKINHPNVIKVHEVGMLGEKVYVAMEFAEGGTVRAWLHGQRRGLPQILDTFVQAGRGLAAAHAAGLIHRDFKPDNVLLAKDGTVRVTDFGLVSAMHPVEDGEPTVDAPPVAPLEMSLSGTTPLSQNLTRTGSIMGTPTYMSPEQFNGGVATARSDQFSFCVALYEALYGERPFAGATFASLATTVTTGKISPPPKTADVPSWLRRVVLRGLSIKPADRFASIDALLSELLRDRTRRTRRIAAIVAGIALAGAGATTYALWPSGAAACKSGADHVASVWNPARRDQIHAAFTASKRPHAPATFDKLVPMLDDWSRDWQTGYIGACEDTRVRGAQSDHMLDLRMQCLTRRLDETGATLDLLLAGGGDTVDHALEAVQRLPAVAPCADTVALSAEVAPPDTELIRRQVQSVRGKLDEARAQDRLGRYKIGRDLAAAALPFARATSYRPIIGEALLALGSMQVELADRAGIASLRESMHVAAEAGDQRGEIDAAAWLVFDFATQHAQYDLAQELAELADAIAINARPRPESVIRLGNARGMLDVARGKLTDAQARYEKVLAFGEKQLGPDHLSVLSTLNQLANTLKAEGKFADARTMLERVVATRERLYGKDHPDVASALNNLGNVYRVEGKLDDAKQLYDRALAIRVAALGPDHPDVATSYNNLGTFYDDKGDNVTALEYYEKALALWEKIYGPDSVELAMALQNTGSVLSTIGKYDEARKRFERARKLIEAAKGPDDPQIAALISNLAVISQREHKLDDALAAFRQAEGIATKAYGADHPDVVDYLGNEATVLKAQKKYAEAQDVDERVIAALKKIYGADHVRVAMALSNLGDVQGWRDDPKGQFDSDQQALAIFEAKLGKDHVYCTYPLLGMGQAMIDQKRPADAISYLQRAVDIRKKAAMQPGLIAEAIYTLGQALAATPATHVRGLAEVNNAIALWTEAKDDGNVAEARAWLAKHAR